ncbi:hypothetical protein E1091_06545 [Micromonospora fluostatini]|uniref:Lipoprotein n=1 Tax=Micromonospora fluostatini TaxID=1629071 RepID=A0ABY2DLA1_9ACTN|nr:hypothetical protein E1091_06545 [Micromonospora fluostatini]
MSARYRTRRLTVGTAFLALAAGGVAACDDAPDNTVQEQHRFYCTTADGTVVDEDHCDDSDHVSGGGGFVGLFFISHSTSYPAGLAPGAKVPPGGRSFPYNDKATRSSWGLPSTGKIGNGSTTKVNVVGKGGAPVSGGGAKAGG